MSQDRPLRVAIDLRLAAYRGGGIARYAAQLAAALREYTEVDPLGVRSSRDREAGAGSIQVRTPPHHRLEEWALGAEMLLRGRGVDLYHATDFIAPRLVRAPVVATAHDLAFLRWPHDLAPDSLAYYRRIRKSRQRTDHWIVPSNWTAGDLAELLDVPDERITVIPHGVTFFAEWHEPLPRDKRGAYILAVGTVEPRKRYRLLLDALGGTSAQVEVKIAGASGWRSDELERRLRSTPGVEWLRDVDDRRLGQLYREAIAVVVPSRAEGFGFAALEAMAAGTPVVSSGRGALPEVTGDYALVPDSDEADAWRLALEQIIEDWSLWERLSTAGFERSREFTWKRSAELTAGVYRRVAG